jgi:type IV pilus assembly protein PilN
MIKINLLPVAQKVRAQDIRRQIIIGVVVVLLAVLLMGYFWFLTYRQVSGLKDDVAGMERKLAALRKEVGDLSQIKKQIEALQMRKETIGNLSKNRLVVVKVLEKLSALKPDALYFTSLEQKNTGEPWQDFSLVLKGVATDNEVIAQFMRELQKVPFFPDVDLDYTKAKSGGEGYQEFQIMIRVSSSPKPLPNEEEVKRGKG